LPPYSYLAPMKRVLECVPNFSEGEDAKVIQQIADAIAAVEGVKLLNVDPGKSTNRTVITFAGEPEAVIEGAFQGFKIASELIDMRKHKGEHPRMGATDVCPLVPISGITVEEAVKYAHILAERVGRELNIPVYLYEYAAQSPQRKSLADIRAGEYEGFEHKILLPEWKPDYGPQDFNAVSGQSVIGVRDILIAYNVNLNTTSVRRANSVAFDVREAGRVQTDANGKTLKDADGNPLRTPGTLKHVRAIGWYIEEFGFAQVSMNLTNTRETPLHIAFDETEKSCIRRGIRVTGSEIVGLVPKQALIDAGKFFLQKQNRSVGLPERELIRIGIKSLGLDELYPFDPQKKVIEYVLEGDNTAPLVNLKVNEFVETVSSESPAPGGGSVAALCGALGGALGAMVANLSANKKGWDDKVTFFSELAEPLVRNQERLLRLVDEDTQAFNRVMEAYRLPKATEAEKALYAEAVEKANQGAANIPLLVMETAFSNYEWLEKLIEHGNPNSITDVGVGVLCTHACIEGAALNVEINLSSVQEETFKVQAVEKVAHLRLESLQLQTQLLGKVRQKMA